VLAVCPHEAGHRTYKIYKAKLSSGSKAYVVQNCSSEEQKAQLLAVRLKV
jgi:hypothetical protein